MKPNSQSFSHSLCVVAIGSIVWGLLPTHCLAQEHSVAASRILENPYDFSQPPDLPTVEPPRHDVLEAAITRGVSFLVQSQRESGAWGAATQTKGLNIYAPVPGAHDAFRCATTSLCIAALLEVAQDNPEAMQAVDRAETWLFEQLDDLRRATGDALYNVWGHAYAIQALVRMRG
ncbi:MAG: hypothetical protein KDA60_03320, partial [Planctomycetales bacterium]|nr:hypothetical protein [Planctomycetales bacterium]